MLQHVGLIQDLLARKIANERKKTLGHLGAVNQRVSVRVRDCRIGSEKRFFLRLEPVLIGIFAGRGKQMRWVARKEDLLQGVQIHASLVEVSVEGETAVLQIVEADIRTRARAAGA
jgi:hypothetical protein